MNNEFSSFRLAILHFEIDMWALLISKQMFSALRREFLGQNGRRQLHLPVFLMLIGSRAVCSRQISWISGFDMDDRL